MLRTVSLLMLMGVSLLASQIDSNIDDRFYEKSVKEAPNGIASRSDVKNKNVER